METTINTSGTVINTVQKTTATPAAATGYDRWIEKLKFSYFSIIAMTITIGSILGGVAAMFVLQNNAPIWELGVCMAVSMANNVACLAQAPTKWVVNLFLLCVGVNALLILINVI